MQSKRWKFAYAGGCWLRAVFQAFHCPLPTGSELDESSATRKLELRGDIAATHMGSRSTTPLLRNPMDVRHCSQHAGANVDFGVDGAVGGALLGNLEVHRALLLA